MSRNKSSYVEFLEGMVVGGSLAAMAVYVFGTDQGKKLQKQLMDNYKKVGHKAGFYVHKVQRAAKSPIAKKLKRIAKNAVKRKSVRQVIRTARRGKTTRKAK